MIISGSLILLSLTSISPTKSFRISIALVAVAIHFRNRFIDLKCGKHSAPKLSLKNLC